MLSAVHVGPPVKRPLSDSWRHKKKKSRTSTRQGTPATEEASRGAEVYVAESTSKDDVEEPDFASSQKSEGESAKLRSQEGETGSAFLHARCCVTFRRHLTSANGPKICKLLGLEDAHCAEMVVKCASGRVAANDPIR